MAPSRTRHRDVDGGRGWRRFFAVTAPGVEVVVEAAGHAVTVLTGRGGYIDAVVAADLEPGWATVALSVEGSTPSLAPVRVVGPNETLGIISDIDDTVMVTALPRPLLAFWNTFVRRETARRPVPGIAELYATLDAGLGAPAVPVPVFYLSTGAWNVAPALDLFLARHGFPAGPLLLTDWGPTPDSWFRSGRAHKSAQLERLFADLPQLNWVLVGDDGQHDPELYADVASAQPDRVVAIAIRELTPAQQVLTHGTPEPLPGQGRSAGTPPPATEVRGPDGYALAAALRERGVLDGRPARAANGDLA
jgi:phosphatidate phosphatase APP1